MPIGQLREKVLFGLGRARGRVHRYTWWRWAVGITFTVLVALLPLLGILRFDVWSGRHMWLGEQVGLVEAAKAFAFPFLAINVLIVIVSRFFGRYLCGFVCPYGSLARLAEWFRWREGIGGTRALRFSALLAVSALLTAITFSFWVDWRVFAEGSSRAIGLSSAFLLGGTLVLFLAIDRLGLRFCHDWCPSGVYFAVLGPKTANGIEFAHPDSCTDCGACEKACPMDLVPRDIELADPDHERVGSGLYPDSMTNHSLCIRCGDCVVACEGMTSRFENPIPLRMGFLPPEGARTIPESHEHEQLPVESSGDEAGRPSASSSGPDPRRAAS